MLSQNIASKQANKDEDQSTTGGGGGGGRKTSSLRPPDQILKCPRCDSPNTKFCYYNNYSLAQPRHFCKACRRYWTKGGALRNVPVGGSCRKSKKTKSSCSSSNLDIGGGMKFYDLSAIDFQLGGLNHLPPPRVVTTTCTNQFSSSYGDTSTNIPNSFDPLLGFNFPFSSSHNIHVMKQQGDHQSERLASFHDEMGTSNIHLHQNTHHDLASSIESLSSINQDLHWKLQQQRLAMLYAGAGAGGEKDEQQKQVVVVDEPTPVVAQKLQPILFQNLETSKPPTHESSSMDAGDHSRKDDAAAAGGNGLATEWFFDNSSSYAAPLNLNPSTPTNSNSAGNNDQNGISINNWNGIHLQAWNHFS